ncbi:MAG: DUF423 domain-containing protein [Afipia sp.]|jgi:uncharacterized membrane protein YgdD (TMEM256/DUF423 family)|nr:DUF423 domain-containing protein [Afipia sp.]MBS4003728.1 DUF423 domain-containing protein [Afipia sp.]WIG53841.1 MAG: hypothetical protein OJF48_004762 [Afipia sp.]
MTQNGALRLAAILAGLMGAAGVALAAASAHLPDASRLASASSMLLFHASAVIGAALLTGHGIARRGLGLAATFGFIVGAALFAGDLTMRQYAGHGLFTMAAPTGGTLLILSWLVLAIAAAWPRRAG